MEWVGVLGGPGSLDPLHLRLATYKHKTLIARRIGGGDDDLSGGVVVARHAVEGRASVGASTACEVER